MGQGIRDEEREALEEGREKEERDGMERNGEGGARMRYQHLHLGISCARSYVGLNFHMEYHGAVQDVSAECSPRAWTLQGRGVAAGAKVTGAFATVQHINCGSK